MTKARNIADSNLEDLVVQNDIEVSGGIYLGGTGSANYLEDYEEGTWTPNALTGTGSVSLNNPIGFYEKIGSFVRASFNVNVDTVSSPAGLLLFSLPFASANVVTAFQNGYIRFAANDMSSYFVVVDPNSSTMAFGRFTGNNRDFTMASDLSGNEQILVSVSYRAET